MPLTGTGTQIGSATRFGASLRAPRALATNGTTVWLFDANTGYTLNPTTGVATPVAARVTNFGNTENQVRSATYHNGQVLVFGRRNGKIQVFNTTDGTLSEWHTRLINYADRSMTGRPDLWGIASLNGTLYGADRQTDALYTISALGVLTRVGTVTQFGINAGRVQGFTAYRGKLIGADTSLDKIVEIHPTTGAATIIAPTNSFPDGSPEALVEFGGQLFLAGSQNDAWFRLYDVLWDETIAAIEVDAGGSTTKDLSTVSQDAASFEFAPGRTARSWVTLSGTEIRITHAPAVTEDTDFEEVVRAVRDGVHAEKTLTVTVRERTVQPPPPPRMRSVPRFTTAPLDVKVELTPTTALMTWKAPTNGASLRAYEISYAEGASPGTTWIPTESLSTRFFVKGLKRRTQYTWQVRGVTENGIGAESRPVTEMTPIASLHNALFFKECVNYFDEGVRVSEHGDPSNIIRAVADNNYQTFTREKDLALNIAVGGQPTRVDAIFVKGIDIEGHSAAPMGGTGSGYSNRVMPATVKNWEGTDVSTVVNGFQHDLYLLDEPFTATSVRMTFTGANAKITEIMLLEFGLEIDANGDFTQINPDFVDREGVVHPDPGGGIAYDPPIGNQRDKWEVDYVVRVVPGKTILETPEDFLYWRSENRNHVFCMEPSRFPWRIFPATFVRKSVPIRYRTDSKTSGEILSFKVAEQ